MRRKYTNSLIEVTSDGKTYPIQRDVASHHPKAVHDALGTHSEHQIQYMMDHLDVRDWYDAQTGKHLGVDQWGLAVYWLDQKGQRVMQVDVKGSPSDD